MNKTLDPDREIYPNATLRLVAFEARFPEIQDVDEASAAFDAAIKQTLPIPGPVPQEITVEFQKSGAPTTRHRNVGLRRLDRTSRNSVVLLPQSLVVECSLYTRFEDFQALIETALRALEETVEIAAITRLGLRYIDEIESKYLPTDDRWTRFLDPPLLAPLYHFDQLPREFQTQVAFGMDDNMQLACRYGISRSPVVNHDGPLTMDGSVDGDRLVIDLDSSWSAGEDELPALVVDDALDRVFTLHAPIRDLFERSITEELRTEVLRRTHE